MILQLCGSACCRLKSLQYNRLSMLCYWTRDVFAFTGLAVQHGPLMQWVSFAKPGATGKLEVRKDTRKELNRSSHA
jgi:hypothetical protein